ncbi:MAG: hypothetical protein AB1758_15100, partial [Candidatus Eremiobacterota bacterium]
MRRLGLLVLAWLVLAAPGFAQDEVDRWIRCEPPLYLHRASPYVSEDAFLFVEPPVELLRQRLRMVQRVAQGRGVHLHYVYQGLYGSGFLPLNPVGNDLDAAVGVHLGRVRLLPGAEAAATRQVLWRVEQFLQVVEQVFSRQEGPEMAVLRFRLLKDGRFKDRHKLVERMRASLADVARGRPHAVLVDSLYGLRVPTVLAPSESYLYETTRIELLSNQVRSTDWMTPGIRGFQVMFHFYCDLEVEGRGLVEDFPFHPTFVPSGRVLRLEEDPLTSVPADAESASFFTRVALDDPDAVAERRLWLATDLLSEVDRNLAAGNPLKALKRLYQAANALGPVLPPDYFTRLHASVGRALGDPDLQLCNEIGTLAEMARKTMERPTALADFLDSFDLTRLLIGLKRQLWRLEIRHRGEWDPRCRGLRERLDGVIERLEKGFPDTPTREGAVKLLGEVEDLAGDAMKRFMPPLKEVRELRDGAFSRLEEAGLRPLPVYGMPDGTLGVLPADSAGLRWEDLPAMGAPPFVYREIQPAQIPLDRRQKPVGPSTVLWLRTGSVEPLMARLKTERPARAEAPEPSRTRRAASVRFLE